jgi:hypothetical protein
MHIDASRVLVARVQVQAMYGPQSVVLTFCNHHLMFPVKSSQVDTHTTEQNGPLGANKSSEHAAQGLLGQLQAASGKSIYRARSTGDLTSKGK